MSEENKNETMKLKKTTKRTKLDEGKSNELLAAEQEEKNTPTSKLGELDKQMIIDESESIEEANAVINEEEEKLMRKNALNRAHKKVNPETPLRILTKRPASGMIFQGEAELHMLQTYALLVGQNSPKPITGLFASAKKLNELIGAYRKGCPFAAKFLMDIEKEIQFLNERIKAKDAEITRFLVSLTPLKLKKFTSKQTADPDLTFVNPYSYHYMALLLQYDEMLRKIFPYYQTSLLDYERFAQVTNEFGRHFRRLFSSADKYFYVGMESFKKQDTTYLAAITYFGELDKELVSRKVGPQFVALPSHLATI